MSATVKLAGGPFDGVEVPRPEGRWVRLVLREGDYERGATLHRYRPKRDGSYVYDGPDTVVALLPMPGAA